MFPVLFFRKYKANAPFAPENSGRYRFRRAAAEFVRFKCSGRMLISAKFPLFYHADCIIIFMEKQISLESAVQVNRIELA